MLNVVVESAKSSTATVGDWLNQWCEFGVWLCIYYTNSKKETCLRKTVAVWQKLI